MSLGVMRVVKTIEIPAIEDIDEGIKKGNFNWVHPDINKETFPHQGNKGGEVVLVEIKDHPMSSDEVAWSMGSDLGLTPGTIEDLLGLAVVDPTLQQRYPIICLSPHQSFPYSFNGKGEKEDFVCGLWRREEKRTLSLFWYKEDWPTTDFYFIARKIN